MNRRSFLQAGGLGSTAMAMAASTQPAAAQNDGKGNFHDQSGFEFLGRSNQEGPTVTHFGYLTHIFGLADELCQSQPTHRIDGAVHFLRKDDFGFAARAWKPHYDEGAR